MLDAAARCSIAELEPHLPARAELLRDPHRRRVAVLRRRRGRVCASSRSVSVAPGTRRTSSTAASPSSRTSASTTSSTSARRVPTSRRRRPGSSKPGSTLVLGETDPDLVPLFEARDAGRAVVRAAATSACTENRLAHGGRYVEPRDARRVGTRSVLLSLHGAHQADNAAIALAAAEAFLGRPLDADARRRRPRPRRARRAGSRWSDTSRSCSSTARTTSPARTRWPRRSRRSSPQASRTLVVGLLREKDPGEMLEALGRRAVRPVSCAAGLRALAGSTPATSPTRRIDGRGRTEPGRRWSTPVADAVAHARGTRGRGRAGRRHGVPVRRRCCPVGVPRSRTIGGVASSLRRP